jgi:hypothetical protein
MAKMGRLLGLGCLAIGLGWLSGCAYGPVPGNPLLVQPDPNIGLPENPLFVPQGPNGYGMVFDRTYDVIQEYFHIKRSNRFDGLIVSWPLMTAGYFDWPRLGLYDGDELLQSTFQTIRRTAVVKITPAASGGFLIDVQVLKELEDLPKPAQAGAGLAVIRPELPIERQTEVVEALVPTKGWIPIGRDRALERVILDKIRSCL